MKLKFLFILLILYVCCEKKGLHTQTKEKPVKKKKQTVKLKKYFKVIKDTDEEIKAEDIKININTDNTSDSAETKQVNFLGLSILWAHFQAYRQGLLREDKGAPWEYYQKTEQNNSRNLWRDFLEVIIDENWGSWIKDLEEVKIRTIKAFENL